eukprot:TRINITY_DN15821_c0_g6_i2.p1 TRINITY_DN15821_c0_g6~~TRINITY_DN15821_c0_g6_i2.p1  ORF type:complete len:395 (+),score=94.88 TRINITY_DN15821_c0_g6_i2:112-1296(+)
MSQPKDSTQGVSISKAYLRFNPSSSNNLDAQSFVKSSPLLCSKPSKRSANKSGSKTRCEVSAANSSITKNNPYQVKANVLNQNLIHGKGKRREARSFSQVSKSCLNKSKTKQESKDFKANESLNYGVVNGKKNFAEIDDITHTIERSSDNNQSVRTAAHGRQTLGKTKESVAMKSTGSLRRKPSSKSDSEYVELASELEYKLRRTITEGCSSEKQDKFAVYRNFFKEIIKSDPYFGGLLKIIQDGYETKLKNMREIDGKLRSKLEEERRKRKESEQQKLLLLKELKQQAIYVENLKANIRELNRSNRENKENIHSNYNTRPVQCKKLKNVAIPMLDLTKIHSQVEDVESGKSKELGLSIGSNADNILDYHDEFMAMENLFSQSWKDALAKEKRY